MICSRVPLPEPDGPTTVSSLHFEVDAVERVDTAGVLLDRVAQLDRGHGPQIFALVILSPGPQALALDST